MSIECNEKINNLKSGNINNDKFYYGKLILTILNIENLKFIDHFSANSEKLLQVTMPCNTIY
jgi:hypothetical protein